jgi:hypothetical protein
MSNELFKKIQDEITLKMEQLNETNDPVLRRDLLLSVRSLLNELDKLAAQSINELLDSERK